MKINAVLESIIYIKKASIHHVSIHNLHEQIMNIFKKSKKSGQLKSQINNFMKIGSKFTEQKIILNWHIISNMIFFGIHKKQG